MLQTNMLHFLTCYISFAVLDRSAVGELRIGVQDEREAVRDGGNVQIRRAIVSIQRQGFHRHAVKVDKLERRLQARVLPTLQRVAADGHHGRVGHVPLDGRHPAGVPCHVRRVVGVPGGRRHGRHRQQHVGETAE